MFESQKKSLILQDRAKRDTFSFSIKMFNFGDFFEKLQLAVTVLSDRSISNRAKISGIAKIDKFK